ncbi:MAG TPA: histidine kinase [Saprospiraceae bacterium]|nr:histidine kinase [Saprospiraceae bacterium]
MSSLIQESDGGPACSSQKDEMINGPVRVLIMFILVTLHNKILYEYCLRNKKNIQYILGLIFLITSFYFINVYTPFSINPAGGLSTLISTIFIYVVGLGFYFMHKNILEKNILSGQQLLEKEEEIRYLKAQLNPHFLFNAMNNLYGTSLSKPDEISERILELSELLRYQIESSQKESILIRDEINYLDKYINYELNRNHKLKIDFKKEGNFGKLKFAPLLLMPFIENAIKFSSETKEPSIKIDIALVDKSIDFKLLNNYSRVGTKKKGTNIGLINTKKRLELIYRNKYCLLITDQNGLYDVYLNLKL